MFSSCSLLSLPVTRKFYPLKIRSLCYYYPSPRTTEIITYRPPFIVDVEQIEDYRISGFHLVHLGDTFADGRYRILRKLGYGGFSTVWLARDKAQNQLVSLKILTAKASSSCPDVEILQALKANPLNHPGRRHIMFVLDHFAIQGPNGSHICLVSQVAGPSIVNLSYSPGQVAGCRRLRGDVARLFARQTAQAIGFLQAAGFIHGG